MNVRPKDWLARLDRIEADQFTRLVRATLAMSIMGVCSAWILADQHLDGMASEAVARWLWVFTAVGGVRVVSAVYLQRHPVMSGGRGWRASVLAGTLAHGLLWGICSDVLLWPGTPEAEALLHVVLCAVALGAAVDLSGLPAVLTAYVLMVLGPLVLRDLTLGGHEHGVMALLSALVGAYTLVNGRNQSRMIGEILAQRRANADLAAGLRQAKERAESARQVAEQASAARARFLAAANHDLRQPLNAMGLLLQPAGGTGVSPPSAEVAVHLQACVAGMTQVVDELLDIARLDMRGLTPREEVLPLSAVLAEVDAAHAAPAQAKGLRLTVFAPEVAVRTDRALLGRILSNLVANAVRYTEQGEVRLEADLQQEDKVVIRIVDTGIGMSEEALPHIFTEFYQVGNPGRDRRQGLGLGLATVKRLSDLMGLTLQVQSVLGRGSVFSLWLPRARLDQVASLPVQGREVLEDGLCGRRVLLVEDDEASRLALKSLLEGWGMQVCAEADGPSALSCVGAGVGRFVPDVLIADLRLAGGETGTAVVQLSRRTLGREDLPALLVTGDVGSPAMRAAQAQGLTVMAKPIRPMPLRAFLLQAFAGHREPVHLRTPQV